jgi:hypothetical protein
MGKMNFRKISKIFLAFSFKIFLGESEKKIVKESAGCDMLERIEDAAAGKIFIKKYSVRKLNFLVKCLTIFYYKNCFNIIGGYGNVAFNLVVNLLN